MDAVDFLKTYRRICNNNDCADCPLWMDGCMITYEERFSESKVVSTIEQRAQEHPVKTRQSEFLKMFPNAKLNDAKVISVPPCEVDESLYSKEKCHGVDCGKCRRNYWLQPLE